MKLKVIIASVIVVAFVIFGSYSFLEGNVEYTDVAGAIAKPRKVQLKGTWNKEKPSEWLKHTFVNETPTGLQICYKPVVIDKFTPQKWCY